MKYTNIREATFLRRLNRFVAEITVDGETVLCHVKNTGRCAELLLPGAKIYVQAHPDTTRKTKFTLISVYKGDILFNLDSYAPNIAAREWLSDGGLGFIPDYLKPEAVFGRSRFDFYWEYGDRKGYVEVKGVTLEIDGAALFPDAPTERGVKHLEELIVAKEAGFEAAVLFVVQFAGATHFSPNEATHPAFAETLKRAQKSGVLVISMACTTTYNTMTVTKPVPVKLK